MSARRPHRLIRPRADRGSTFVIVLAILSLLVITAATLTYTSGLEVRAAGNFTESVQARMAAQTGLPASATAVNARPSLATGLNQSWASQAKSSSRQEALQQSAADAGAQQNAGINLDWARVSQSALQIEDQSGKLALNSILPAQSGENPSKALPPSGFTVTDLEGVIQRAAQRHSLTGIQPALLAESIVKKRYGEDGLPGSPDDPLVFEEEDPGRVSLGTIEFELPILLDSDPRVRNRGDDQPFTHIDQIASLEGMPEDPAENARALAALSQVLTVYSQSFLAFELEGKRHNCLDINSAAPEEIYETLAQAYPDHDEAVLKQFAVNLVDMRDPDQIPTIYPGSDGLNPILGIERTPFINEVWPDSMTFTEDGDDGQYFEIFNPHDESISLDGWSVKIGLTGSTIALDGDIAADGFLVVTDDRAEQNDPTPELRIPEYGSFFDLFDMLGDNGARRIIEDGQMELPDRISTLYLYDQESNLVDYFFHGDMAQGGVRNSAQRGDPRIRSYTVERCTPLERNRENQTSPGEFSHDMRRDKPFLTPAGVFNVFIDKECGKLTSVTSSQSRGAYPSLDDSGETLDARLVDLFAVVDEQPERLARLKAIAKKAAEEETPEETADSDPGITLEPVKALKNRDSELTLCAAGRININTAAKSVLMALPGVTEEFADRILEARIALSAKEPAENGAKAVSQAEIDGAPFPAISSFLNNETIWEGLSRQEAIAAYRQFANLITVNSQVFLVHSQNQTPPETGQRRPSQARVRSLILVDSQGRPSALNWQFVR
jgi:type II secretory pathway component PulK